MWLHARSYLPYFSDDGFISLRYAGRLIDGHGLTFTDGERVEGYSDLLWVLAVAALGKLGVELVNAARLVGAGGVAAAVAAVVYAQRLRPRGAALASGFAAFSLALAGPIAVWAIGGLEAGLVAGLLAWGIALTLPLVDDGAFSPRRAAWPSWCFGLLCITRGDGPLLVGAVGVAIVAARPRDREAWRLALMLSLAPIAFTVGQLAFRLGYYHAWLPNTAAVKLGSSADRLAQGSAYVREGLLSLLGLVLPATATLALLRPSTARGRRIAIVALPLVAWLVYLVSVGGDFMPGHRHFVPVVVLLAFLSAEALAWTADRDLGWRAFGWLAGAALLAFFAITQAVDPENGFARARLWAWDGQVIGGLLGRAFAVERPLVAVDSAGALPYYAKLPALDMLGLCDAYLPRHPPKLAHALVGHGLGDGDYVLSRAPDLLIFGGPAGGEPSGPGGEQLRRDPRFSARYLALTVEGTTPYRFRSRLWARREGGAIGIRRSANQIVVPGWFLASTPGTIATPDAAGKLGVTVGAAAPARLVDLDVGDGRWSARSEPPTELEAHPHDARLDLTLHAHTPTHVQRIILTRE